MKAGEFIAQILEKVGVDSTDDRLKDVLSINTEVHGDLVKEAEKLLSIEAAKNNMEVKNHYFRRAYDGIDAEILRRAEKIGDADFIEAIKAEKSTGKKNIMLLEKLEEMKTPADDKGLKSEVKKLNDELAKIKETHIPKDELEAFRIKYEQEITDSILETHFLGQKWSESIPEKARLVLAKTALEERLNEIGAKTVRDGKSLKLVKAEDPEQDYFDKSNKSLKFESLVGQIMADNKFIAVSNPAKPVTITSGTPPVTKANSTVQSLLKQSMTDMGLE